ncbi:MAG: hypothetical protein AAGK04_11695 [Planctomycetota bacterium]
MRHATRRTGMVIGLLGCALAGACEVTPRRAGTLDRGRVGDVWNPFAPERLRISPLTHVGRGQDDVGGDGRAQIVCHIELVDADGFTVRGIGDLQVQLYRPRGGGDAGLSEQELRWDVDLSDLEENRVYFDRATGTYRAPLVGVPSWVDEMVEGWSSGGGGGRIQLIATLRTVGPRGEERVLRDEFYIEG